MAATDSIDRPLLSTNGQTPPHGVPVFNAHDIRTIVHEQINREIQSQVEEAVRGGGPPGGGPPPRTYFGDSAKGWGASILKAAIGFCALVFVWYMSVNKGLAERPTKTQAKAIASEEVKQHEVKGTHPDTKLMLKALSESIQKLSDVQIRQAVIVETHDRSIEKNEKKIEKLERRRNR